MRRRTARQPDAFGEVTLSDSSSTTPDRADFCREMLVALVIGAATLASGWASYQSALWEGIQTFRLAAVDSVGRDISVKQVALGQQHLLDLFLLERYLDARESGDKGRTDFLFSRLTPELQTHTRSWLETRPKDNSAAARSPFHMPGYVQQGTDSLEELRRKQATAYAEADGANVISDNYVRITVSFALVLFLGGISALLKVSWPRRALLGGAILLLLASLYFLARMPLAME
jgi:hypothetical protein